MTPSRLLLSDAAGVDEVLPLELVLGGPGAVVSDASPVDVPIPVGIPVAEADADVDDDSTLTPTEGFKLTKCEPVSLVHILVPIGPHHHVCGPQAEPVFAQAQG